MRLIPLLAATAAVALGQTGPDILKKVAETYQSLKSYQFEAQVVTETVSEGSESRSRSTRTSAAVLPDRRRVESKGGQIAGLRVWDGQTVWDFRPGPNQFARHDQATYTPPRMNVLSDPVEAYKGLDKTAANGKLLREETIEAAGAQRPCWVVEVPPRFPAGGFILERSPTTYWIDKSTNLVLKESERTKLKPPMMDSPQDQTATTTYTVARANQPVPEELFHFQPPQGAWEVADFTSPFSTTPLAGKAGPDFTLPDLDGKEVAWSSLKGKPVLVNFWATWCAPCREQMPEIQEALRMFAEKGLVVLAINDGETPDVAKKYVQEHGYTFRVLLDRDKAVARKFSVSGVPALFLIDRDGNIRAQFTGYSSTLDLKEELKKIGM